jgi:hypothetical protein
VRIARSNEEAAEPTITTARPFRLRSRPIASGDAGGCAGPPLIAFCSDAPRPFASDGPSRVASLLRAVAEGLPNMRSMFLHLRASCPVSRFLTEIRPIREPNARVRPIRQVVACLVLN